MENDVTKRWVKDLPTGKIVTRSREDTHNKTYYVRIDRFCSLRRPAAQLEDSAQSSPFRDRRYFENYQAWLDSFETTHTDGKTHTRVFVADLARHETRFECQQRSVRISTCLHLNT